MFNFPSVWQGHVEQREMYLHPGHLISSKVHTALDNKSGFGWVNFPALAKVLFCCYFIPDFTEFSLPPDISVKALYSECALTKLFTCRVETEILKFRW